MPTSAASRQTQGVSLLEVTSLLKEMKAEWKAEVKAEQEEAKKKSMVVSDAQVASLQSRLEALHAAQLLSDDEFYRIEDCVADFLDATASFDVVTMEVVNASDAARTAHKLVMLSEKMPTDAAFARQARRKFV
jgi:hypothetical protein